MDIFDILLFPAKLAPSICGAIFFAAGFHFLRHFLSLQKTATRVKGTVTAFKRYKKWDRDHGTSIMYYPIVSYDYKNQSYTMNGKLSSSSIRHKLHQKVELLIKEYPGQTEPEATINDSAHILFACVFIIAGIFGLGVAFALNDIPYIVTILMAVVALTAGYKIEEMIRAENRDQPPASPAVNTEEITEAHDVPDDEDNYIIDSKAQLREEFKGHKTVGNILALIVLVAGLAILYYLAPSLSELNYPLLFNDPQAFVDEHTPKSLAFLEIGLYMTGVSLYSLLRNARYYNFF